MYKIEYLLKYVSNDTYKKILKKSDYVKQRLEKNYIDVDLNIRYLIKYGITNIDIVVYNMLEELLNYHNDFINYIKEYEKKLNKQEVIMLLENL